MLNKCLLNTWMMRIYYTLKNNWSNNYWLECITCTTKILKHSRGNVCTWMLYFLRDLSLHRGFLKDKYRLCLWFSRQILWRKAVLKLLQTCGKNGLEFTEWFCHFFPLNASENKQIQNWNQAISAWLTSHLLTYWDLLYLTAKLDPSVISLGNSK